MVAGHYWENSSKGRSCGGSMVDEGSEQVGFTVQESMVLRCVTVVFRSATI